MVWNRFYAHRLGRWALYVVIAFCLCGIYAPFLASSKPLLVLDTDNSIYFPLFRYLFYRGFFTKRLDIFFNLLMFTLPLLIFSIWKWKGFARTIAVSSIIVGHLLAFIYFSYFPARNPAYDPILYQERSQAIKQTGLGKPVSWDFDLRYMTPYEKLNLILRYRQRKIEHEQLLPYYDRYAETVRTKLRSAGHDSPVSLPTLWQVEHDHETQEVSRLQKLIAAGKDNDDDKMTLQYIVDRRAWLEKQSADIKWIVMPLLSSYHWEDDAGGQQALNRYVPWWHLTRINRKDLLSALIFGIRVSLTVGIASVVIALCIGLPIGAFAGYYGGKFDIVVSRLLEIWEAMPVFFMLLMVVAILQSKSIFLVTLVIGFFGWTQMSRYVRGEFFKQRNLPYVEACHALGFGDNYTMFKHILPNAIPPVLTLLPFAIMGAITSEAGLSFLGLGEEGSCSWGVLMDEGRTAFPAESYLLWPPAILLTILLVAIAIVGDSLRDTLDPKLQGKT